MSILHRIAFATARKSCRIGFCSLTRDGWFRRDFCKGAKMHRVDRKTDKFYGHFVPWSDRHKSDRSTASVKNSMRSARFLAYGLKNEVYTWVAPLLMLVTIDHTIPYLINQEVTWWICVGSKTRARNTCTLFAFPVLSRWCDMVNKIGGKFI